MRYMIYDEEGNALGAYRSRIAAEGGFRAMAAADPDSADDLVLMLYRDDGSFTGRALTIGEIRPTVRIMESVWGATVAYGMFGGGRAARPRLNAYNSLILAGRRQAEPVVRRQFEHDRETMATH